MVSVQNFRQHNQSQSGMGFGFDETVKQEAQQMGQHSFQCLVSTLTINEKHCCYTFPLTSMHRKSEAAENPTKSRQI
jgi:hypothetical protein